MADCDDDNMDHMDSSELEAELYARIHHETETSLSALDSVEKPAAATTIKNRIVTKRSIVNNCINKADLSKIRKRKSTKERCNPNPFAISSALNNTKQISIPKRLTPYTSYLSQIDSKPVDIHIPCKKSDERPNERPNPLNRVIEKKINRLHSKKNSEAKEISSTLVQTTDEKKPLEQIASTSIVVDSDSDDDLIILPPVIAPIFNVDSSDEDVDSRTAEPEAQQNDNLDNAIPCDFVDDERHRHDNPFGGIDASELNEIVSSVDQRSNVPIEPIHDFARPQQTNRYTPNKSYEVAENDFAATDVYESESSDLPEGVYSKGKKANRVTSGSDSEVETSNRSKRMRKRKSSGSNRSSDYMSDDSDEDIVNDVIERDVVRPFVFRGEAIPNAITRKSKRIAKNTEQGSDQEFTTLLSSIVHCDKNKEQAGYIDMDGDSSSESNVDVVNGSEANSSHWLVKDQVGAPDDVEIDVNIENDIPGNNEMEPNCEDKEEKESNVGDKDDVNCVRSKPLVIHPEMGWNYEMKAFYNDSWGGETYDSKALRKQMPPKNSKKWPIVEADRRANYHLKTIKCLNCRESGHRMQYCPQPRKEIVCYTCGTAGHRSNHCPNAICLRCGAKSNSYTYLNGCKSCLYLNNVHCTRCRVRGHDHLECPENWRSYHNTIDSVSQPKYVPNPRRPRKYCCICAAPGHIAEYCHLLKEEMPSTSVRKYPKCHNTHIPPIDNSKTTPYVMFENPREDFEFNWDVNESKDRIYGRFMEATKIERKPKIETITTNLSDSKAAKRRRLNDDDVVMDSSNEKMVLNPMNPKNIRNAATKPKKQFSKDFYAESTRSAILQSNDCENNIDNGNEAVESILENHENEQPQGLESVSLEDNVDIVMKDTEIVPEITKDNVSANDDGNVEEMIQTNGDGLQETMERDEIRKSLDDNALMLDAIEIDKLKGFSFEKEMEKLEKSKRMFDVSFNGEPSNFHIVNKLPETIAATDENCNEAELRELKELREAQKALNNLKQRLSTLNKSKDNIVLNVTGLSEQSINYDSDSNYSFGEYFDHSKTTNKSEKKNDDHFLELPEYIPLSSTRIESPTNIDNHAGISQRFIDTPSAKAVNEAKIFLSKEHTRMLLTEAGNNFLRESSTKSQIKVRMEWESVGNVLVIIGSKLNQDKFHADLVKYLEDINKKVRLRNETLQLLPKSKIALIRFIREQFSLLLQPLGNPQVIYNNMRVNENLKTKAGTKNADKSRMKLNITLMGNGGLRDGPHHLSGLEKNLKFLLENNKDMMTKQLREEIFQHYRYIFSSYTHDNYPELISEFNELKKSNNLPEINIDRSLLELNISVKDDNCDPVDLDCVSLDSAKRKLMQTKNEESPRRSGKLAKQEPKSPKLESKSPKLELKSPKLSKLESNNVRAIAPDENADIKSKDHYQNAIWSLKCKEILEKCRKLPRIRGSILQKFDLLMEKANNNGMGYDDFINLNKIKESLIQTQN